MKVILAVLKDLYVFVFVYGFGFLSKSAKSTKTAANTASSPMQDTAATALPLQTALNQPLQKPLLLESFESIGYACVPDAFLYALPTRTFDGVIARISYGESLKILHSQGTWFCVRYEDVKGWMRMDDLTQSSASLHPKFATGELYDSFSSETVKLRTLIDDAFHAAPLASVLQDVEYVSYMLHKKDLTINWSHSRPRIAGTWQRLLKGVPGVHIGVIPKSGSIMEYVHENNTGHVAYVHSVYPDNALTLSEVGYPSEGIYNERTLSKEEWRELRPVFIEVA